MILLLIIQAETELCHTYTEPPYSTLFHTLLNLHHIIFAGPLILFCFSEESTNDESRSMAPTNVSNSSHLPYQPIMTLDTIETLTMHKETSWGSFLLAISQLLVMIVCIFVNLLVIEGVFNNKPHLLIPWLVIYLIGNLFWLQTQTSNFL